MEGKFSIFDFFVFIHWKNYRSMQNFVDDFRSMCKLSAICKASRSVSGKLTKNKNSQTTLNITDLCRKNCTLSDLRWHVADLCVEFFKAYNVLMSKWNILEL